MDFQKAKLLHFSPLVTRQENRNNHGGLLDADAAAAVFSQRDSHVLNLPTAGPLFVNALLQQDMYLAGSFLMFLAFLLIFGNLLADILLAWLDPRIQFE